MIVAIDGPAGSGKSSTARAVARALGFRHLDSGAFYRALTHAALSSGLHPDEWPRLSPLDLERLKVSAEPAEQGFRMLVQGRDVSDAIRSAEVTAHVSSMARVPAVRTWLLERLREAGRASHLVADGRDIGTVVFPDAEVKVFLSAAAEERARRRLLQTGLPTDPDSLAGEVKRIEARDRADSTRAVAPLRAAADAVRLDTTGLAFEEQVRRIVSLARAYGGRGEGEGLDGDAVEG